VRDKNLCIHAQWGGWGSNPRPKDYEDFEPKRYATRRNERQRSKRSASNTSLLKRSDIKINN